MPALLPIRTDRDLAELRRLAHQLSLAAPVRANFVSPVSVLTETEEAIVAEFRRRRTLLSLDERSVRPSG
jgi:hypothetical protein